MKTQRVEINLKTTEATSTFLTFNKELLSRKPKETHVKHLQVTPSSDTWRRTYQNDLSGGVQKGTL